MKNNPDTAQCNCLCHVIINTWPEYIKDYSKECQHCAPKEECKQELLCHGKANRSGYCNECGEELCDPTPKEQSQGWKKTDKFMECFKTVKQWFEDEEMILDHRDDFMLGRFAARLRDKLDSQQQELTSQLETLEKQIRKRVINGMQDHSTNWLKYEDVLDCISTLKKEV